MLKESNKDALNGINPEKALQRVIVWWKVICGNRTSHPGAETLSGHVVLYRE